MYINGIQTDVIVDDYFPCFADRQEPIFSKPKGNEIWTMVAEKAWVRIFINFI